MPAIATERFELRRSRRERFVQFDIRGALTEEAALAADGLPQAGAVRDGLIADDPEVERNGPAGSGLYRGIVRYATPTASSNNGGSAGPLISGKPRFEWGDGVKLVTSYVASNGVNVANGVGDPFDPPGQQELFFETLTVTAKASSFDYDLLKTYRGAINADELEMWQPGAIAYRKVKPGTMKCLSIVSESYDVETSAAGKSAALTRDILVIARFEIMEHFPFLPEEQRTIAYSPWHEWRENTSFRGWYSSTGTTTPDSLGDFVDSRSEAVTTPVRLNEDGTPIDSRFKVTDGKKTALKTPTDRAASGYVVYEERGPRTGTSQFPGPLKGIVFVYPRCHALNFTALGSILFPPQT